MFASESSPKTQESCKSISTVLLKRLPIYDSNMQVYAYELMPYTRKAEYVDDDVKRADLLVNTIVNFDLDTLVGDAKVLLSLSDSILQDIENLPFDKDKTIYGLPDNYNFADGNKEKISSWIQQGFHFSLNVNNSVADIIDNLPGIHIVKLNAEKFNAKNMQALTLVSKHNFVISNIKTKDEYDYYCNIGFKYCQGYFLGKSVIYKSQNVGSDLTNVLDLLGKINNSETTVEELEDAVKKDVALTYKLMRFMNSSYFTMKVTVDSVKQALVLIGMKELRTWVSLLLLSGRDDVPPVVSELVLFRARFCELIAEKAGHKNKDVFFTVGLFSGLDMVLKSSLESILEKLPVSDEVRSALLNQEGVMGQAVHCAKSYESGNLDQISFEGLSDEEVFTTFESSLAWSYDIMSFI